MFSLSLMLTASLAAAPVQVAAPTFSVHGLEQKAGDFYADQLAQQLAFRGLKVITRTEIEAVLGNERQRQLVGCGGEDDSCAVELADALGSEALMMGDVARVGDSFRVSVRIIRARNGERVASAVVTGRTEDAILAAFSEVAPQLASQTNAGFRGDAPVAALGLSTRRSGIRQFAWIPAAVGGAAIVGGGYSYLQARQRYDLLRSGDTLIEPEPSRLRTEGQSWQILSTVGFGVGAAGLLTAAGLFLFGSETVVETGVTLAPTGSGVGIAGEF